MSGRRRRVFAPSDMEERELIELLALAGVRARRLDPVSLHAQGQDLAWAIVEQVDK